MPSAAALHGLRDVDLIERQFHRIRVDRGEIENIVDDGEQRRRGFHHIARILALFAVERADRGIVEKLNEADDIGQRRTQLVGDMVDEVIAQLFGSLSADCGRSTPDCVRSTRVRHSRWRSCR